MGLAIIVGINTLIALRLLGFVPAIPLAPLRKLFPWMYVGFTINAFSGLSLLAANLRGDLANTMFLIKLVLIALAMINLELTRARVFDNPTGLPATELPQHARTFAVVSIVLWGLAIVTGRLTAYPNFVETWFGI
jgi:hypothetical protein